MKISNSTKKTIIAMMLGLGLSSISGATINALGVNNAAPEKLQTGNEAASQVQSISDSIDDTSNVNSTYGGCGLSCAGCSLKCF